MSKPSANRRSRTVRAPLAWRAPSIRRVLAADGGIRLIGLSLHVDQEIADAMRAAGACAYLTKGGAPEDLISAIRAPRAGARRMPEPG